MSNKSYQKLKARIEYLEKELKTIVNHPDSPRAGYIKAGYKSKSN